LWHHYRAILSVPEHQPRVLVPSASPLSSQTTSSMQLVIVDAAREVQRQKNGQRVEPLRNMKALNVPTLEACTCARTSSTPHNTTQAAPSPPGPCTAGVIPVVDPLSSPASVWVCHSLHQGLDSPVRQAMAQVVQDAAQVLNTQVACTSLVEIPAAHIAHS
jgi:hypothetical protein